MEVTAGMGRRAVLRDTVVVPIRKGPAMSAEYGYGLWWLVALNSLVFIVFAASFVQPKTKLDWRALGGFSAFVVAMFTEMYGFPLTIFLLSGWLGERVPGQQSLDHLSGHLWQELFGWEGDPHLNPLHLLSNVVIGVGLYLLYRAWRVLYTAQREGRLATTGPYARLRHPQYVGFLAVMVGFLLQSPTVLTLLMFPVLVVVYWRLGRKEEQVLTRQFGTAYQDYARRVPRFVPRLRRQAA
ncbi:methyltransferase family protein [Kocuria carniphila]